MEQEKKLTMVVFSGALDKALASFIIATGGAASGMDVSMFFTFWGLNIIRKKRGVLEKNTNIMQKMFAMVNKGGTGKLKLSKFNMGGMGTTMIKKLMKKKNITSIEELIEMAIQSGVKLYVCDMSRDLMGLDKDSFIEGIKDYIGVASYLDMAADSSFNLFI